MRRIITDAYERLADNIFLEYRDVIEDRMTFNVAFEDFLRDRPQSVNNDDLKNTTFRKYRKHYDGKSKKISPKNLYSKNAAILRVAKGKNINRDKLRTAKTVYVDTAEGRHKYITTGASRSDLDGVDTKDGKKLPKSKLVKVKKYSFPFMARVKGRVIYARKDGKRFRDKFGRFVSVNKRVKK